jgi:ubiquinone/menaquinone biosynthesis C-methylase UbiE
VGVLLGDGAHLPIPDGGVALAVAFMSLQDMDDMWKCAHEAARVLEPGGHLCLAITHPLNSGHAMQSNVPCGPWVIDAGTYWDARRVSDSVERDGHQMTFNSWHRPLESYLDALHAAGLLTETIREPRGTGEISSAFPLFLHLRARKP